MNETLASWTPRALSVLRIIAGLLIIQHGMGKIIGFPAAPGAATVQLMSQAGAAGIIELIGGALLIVGLWTQAAAFSWCIRVRMNTQRRGLQSSAFSSPYSSEKLSLADFGRCPAG